MCEQASDLSEVEKARYRQKLELIDDEDPYTIKKEMWSDNQEFLPSITYPDIVNYLLFTPSPYTAESLKSFKGLDAYNQFVCGWVREVRTKIYRDKRLVKAKVLHSQRIREKPLEPWLVADEMGQVHVAHCNCMAGLGEACTHVAALLFTIEATVKIRNAKTVTEEKAYWLLPTAMKKIEYKEIRTIDFTSAKTKKKQLDAAIGSCGVGSRPTTPDSDSSRPATPATPSTASSRSPTPTGKAPPPAPTEEEMDIFFKAINHCGRSAILSLIEPYSDTFVPESVQPKYPIVLSELYDEEASTMDLDELMLRCASLDISFTKEEADAVERATAKQAESASWFRFRAGRITASRMKSVCRTKPDYPATSLIKAVCYPGKGKFKSAATDWGCSHEKWARELFCEVMQHGHDNFRVEECGLFLNPDFPYLGASPDGIATCDCCGTCCVEIKCPFCVKDMTFDSTDSKFYLKHDGNILKLDTDHQYHYQIQTQLGVCQLESAYFVVWTEKDLHIETIKFDADMFADMCRKAQHIFDTAILPELVGKYFTRTRGYQRRQTVTSTVLPSTSEKPTLSVHPVTVTAPLEPVPSTSQQETWCFCGQTSFGEMIGCDNPECSIEWFHYVCVGVEKAPRGKWFCSDCRKLPKFLKRGGKSKSKD